MTIEEISIIWMDPGLGGLSRKSQDDCPAVGVSVCGTGSGDEFRYGYIEFEVWTGHQDGS